MMGRDELKRFPPTPGVEVWAEEKVWDMHTTYDYTSDKYVTHRIEGTMRVPSTRWFDGPVMVANRAAERYAELMGERVGRRNVYLVDSEGDHWQPRHWRGPHKAIDF